MDYRNAISGTNTIPRSGSLPLRGRMVGHRISKSSLRPITEEVESILHGPWTPRYTCHGRFVGRLPQGSKGRPLILVSGLSTASSFLDGHPNSLHLQLKKIGYRATTPFHGRVDGHSNAACNLSAVVRLMYYTAGQGKSVKESRQKLRKLRSKVLQGWMLRREGDGCDYGWWRSKCY